MPREREGWGREGRYVERDEGKCRGRMQEGREGRGGGRGGYVERDEGKDRGRIQEGREGGGRGGDRGEEGICREG